MKHNIDDAQLQAAIDKACQEVAKGPHRPICAELALQNKDTSDWEGESSARLALAKAFLASLPMPPPVVEAEEAYPYAKLKAAHAEGKVIQYTDDTIYRGEWKDCRDPLWIKEDKHHINPRYRVKPEPENEPEPSTFEAHGHTWTKASHRPQNGAAPVYWLLESELSGARPYAPDFISTSENLGDWEGIVGWRYADEPEPVPAWQPAVGDVVTLKSGSPKMTVCQIQGTVCKCQWFRGDEADVECFEIATLQPA